MIFYSLGISTSIVPLQYPCPESLSLIHLLCQLFIFLSNLNLRSLRIWNLVSNLEKPRLQTLTSHRHCPSEFKFHMSETSYCATCLSPFYTVVISNFLHFSQTPHSTTSLLAHSRKPCSYFTEKIEAFTTLLAWPQSDQVIYTCTQSLHPNPSGALVFSHHRDQRLSIIPFLDPSHQHLSILKPFPFSKKKLRRLFNSTLSLRYHHLSSLCSQNS